MLGNRSFAAILRAIRGKQHYRALWNMYRHYPRFLANLGRYLTGYGRYPHEIDIATPTGIAKARLHSHHDLLTVNEIFCRLDYVADRQTRAVVDIGSNIGISALYFLTRNPSCRCYLFEPDPRNVARLRQNLSRFEERFELTEAAIADQAGTVKFSVEPTGRYGRIGDGSGVCLDVDCLEVNAVLARILAHEPVIDILKVDTEGVEIRTVAAIQPAYLRRIKKIYLEAEPPGLIHEGFEQYQYGSVCQLTNRLWMNGSSAAAA